MQRKQYILNYENEEEEFIYHFECINYYIYIN